MEADLRLVGGNVAVDLVNTRDPDVPGGDHLTTDADVVAWLQRVGLPGRATLEDTRALRTRIDAVLRPLARGAEPPAPALDDLRVLEADALARATLHSTGPTWTDPLPRIVHAAFTLLLHGPLDRLRECGNCPWLFLDLSRNHSRRWCSMASCGTEIKVRRLTERRRNARAGLMPEEP